MLRIVDLPRALPDDDVAGAVLEAWADATVVHIRPEVPGDDLRAYYDHLISVIGRAVPLAEDATIQDRESQRTGQVWMEVRYDPTVPNAYRHSAAAQPLHTDGSYIPDFPGATLMYCVAAARTGGATVFLDAPVLVEILETHERGLLEALRDTPMPHKRSGDRRVEPVIREDGHGILLNWNYFCVDQDAPLEALDIAQRLHRFLKEQPQVDASCEAVTLRPGEAVVWKDERLLHGRRAFDATEPSERFIWKCAVAIGATDG